MQCERPLVNANVRLLGDAVDLNQSGKWLFKFRVFDEITDIHAVRD
jgi:hypothetical protein